MILKYDVAKDKFIWSTNVLGAVRMNGFRPLFNAADIVYNPIDNTMLLFAGGSVLYNTYGPVDSMIMFYLAIEYCKLLSFYFIHLLVNTSSS